MLFQRQPFIVIFCFLGWCLAALAQEIRDVPAFSTEPKALLQAAAAIPRSADTGTFIVLNDFHYKFEADGRYVLTRRRIVQVLNADGMDSWKSIRVGWAPWQETRPITLGDSVAVASGRVVFDAPKGMPLKTGTTWDSCICTTSSDGNSGWGSIPAKPNVPTGGQ